MYKRKTASPRCLLKLDLKKAYDSVDWDFLSNMMEALGFPNLFQRLIMECVTTTSYTLSINGEQMGFFRGRRGLRQGDPLSPLLFTLCMEYLSRILGRLKEVEGFKFHPLCNRLKLNHLLFADDVVLFSRGDIRSVTLLLRAVKTFSKASGLEVNRGKSDIYYNGVKKQEACEINNVSGCKQGTLPFKYLGVPISNRKINKLDCNVLVEKIVERIRGWGARRLSYAGRLVMIQAVLSTMHMYWASMFMLPISVIKKVESICRTYLWEGRSVYSRAPLVRWEICCLPKEEGGLGIKSAYEWNIAAVGKIVWWVYEKKDHLWIKWVNDVYLRGGDWQEYHTSSSASWAWKRICAIKEKFKEGYMHGKWIPSSKGYSIKEGYKWLKGEQPEVGWQRCVWNRLSIPKHSFNSWLIQHGRLQTKVRLKAMGICKEEVCDLCGQEKEDIQHLFFSCKYSSVCLKGIMDWMQLNIPYSQTWQWSRQCSMRSKVQRQIVWMVISACAYHIWNTRNKVRMEQVLAVPEIIINQVKTEAKSRIQEKISGSLKVGTQQWICKLMAR